MSYQQAQPQESVQFDFSLVFPASLINNDNNKNDKESFLKLDKATEELWDKRMNKKSGWGLFNLALSNANIKRVRDRINGLKLLASRTTTEISIKGVRLIQNAEANRVQIIFPERIPNDMYIALRHKGFVYCKTERAFQRKLNSWAYYVAKDFLETMEMDFSKKDE